MGVLCACLSVCLSLSLFPRLLWMGRMSSLRLTWSSSSSLLEILCNLRKTMGFHYYSYKSCCHSSLQLSNLVYIPPISLSLSLSLCLVILARLLLTIVSLHSLGGLMSIFLYLTFNWIVFPWPLFLSASVSRLMFKEKDPRLCRGLAHKLQWSNINHVLLPEIPICRSSQFLICYSLKWSH
jgi:hypothetical protein